MAENGASSVTDDQVVMVQVKRGERWVDFTAGTVAAARRHIAQNTAAVWRAVDVAGRVVLPPRVHVHAPMLGVVTDGIATCECGRRIALADDGSWRTDWPPRRESVAPDPGMNTQTGDGSPPSAMFF